MDILSGRREMRNRVIPKIIMTGYHRLGYDIHEEAAQNFLIRIPYKGLFYGMG
jgi:hypothetical protein